MDVFNNREIAVLIWFTIIFIALHFYKVSREGFYVALKILWQPMFAKLFVLCVAYIGGIIYFLCSFGLWDISQLKNTLIWGFTVALVSIGRAIKAKDSSHLLGPLIIDNIKLIVAIEFIVGFYPMSLCAEFILLPVATLLVMMIAVASNNEEHATVKKLFDWMLIALGMFLIARALYHLATDFNDFGKVDTLIDFSLPPILSLLYLPFVYCLYIYVKYNTIFMRMGFKIKDKDVLRYAKRKTILSFHFQVKHLNEWSKTLVWIDIESIEDVATSINQYKELYRKSQNPPDVDLTGGWSPFMAMNYLEEEGLSTALYHPTIAEEWSASSGYIKLSNDMFPNKIIYYISGNEHAVTMIKLAVDVCNLKKEEEAIERMNELMAVLIDKLKITMSSMKDIPFTIEEGSSTKFDQATVNISRESYGTSGEYYVDLEIIHDTQVS